MKQQTKYSLARWVEEYQVLGECWRNVAQKEGMKSAELQWQTGRRAAYSTSYRIDRGEKY
jgi:hypothetical protein